jgi:hypothetical protein
VEERIKAVRDALGSNDMPRVRSAAEELARTTQRIAQETAAQEGAPAGAASGSEPPTSPSGSEAETIEGEYHEV